jgi:hypothetical protein
MNARNICIRRYVLPIRKNKGAVESGLRHGFYGIGVEISVGLPDIGSTPIAINHISAIHYHHANIPQKSPFTIVERICYK